MEQCLYELLHNRGLRQSLARTPLFFTEDFRNISGEQLRRSSNQQLLQNHRDLNQDFPHLYREWQRRFPFDVGTHIALELTSTFQESNEYKQARYLTQDDNEKSMGESFENFCQNFWNLVTTPLAHTKKETIMEVSNFHVHYYKPTKQRLRGPHPLDMKNEILSVMDLKDKMQELLTLATLENSILIHTCTEDDLYDHTYGAIWLGRTLPLDFSKLD